jgi:hypothetical protein
LERTIGVDRNPHHNYIVSSHDVTKAEVHLFVQTNNSHDSHIGVKLEAFISLGGAGGYDFVHFVSFWGIFYDLSVSQTES